MDNFTDRRQTLYLGGEPGSGKSSLLNIFLNVTPKHRVFSPVYESGFPFSAIKPWHLIGNYQEFRLMPKWSPSTTLLMLERAENAQLDVKNEGSTSVPRGPRNIMTSNHLTPKGPWSPEDVVAVLDRVVPMRWDLKRPAMVSECNVLEARCRRRSVEIMRFCSPEMARDLVI